MKIWWFLQFKQMFFLSYVVKDEHNQSLMLSDTFSHLNVAFQLLQAFLYSCSSRHRSSTGVCTQEALREWRDSDYNTYSSRECGHLFDALGPCNSGCESKRVLKSCIDPLWLYATYSATSCLLRIETLLHPTVNSLVGEWPLPWCGVGGGYIKALQSNASDL